MNGSVREARQARLNKERVCVFAERGSGPALREKKGLFSLAFFLGIAVPNSQ